MSARAALRTCLRGLVPLLATLSWCQGGTVPPPVTQAWALPPLVPVPLAPPGRPETILAMATEVPFMLLADPIAATGSGLGVRMFQSQGDHRQVILVRLSYSAAVKSGALAKAPAALRRAMIADFMVTWGDGFAVLPCARAMVDGREGEAGVLVETAGQRPVGKIFATTDEEGATLVSVCAWDLFSAATIADVIEDHWDWLAFLPRSSRTILDAPFGGYRAAGMTKGEILQCISREMYKAGYFPSDHGTNPTWTSRSVGN